MFIPCRKCACGLYSDVSVSTCGECGSDMRSLPVMLTDIESIGVENAGDIDSSIDYYVQHCDGCGKDNYLAVPEYALKLCSYCGKSISEVIPARINKKTGESQTTLPPLFAFKSSAKTAGVSLEEMLRSIDSKVVAQESQIQCPNQGKSEPMPIARGPKIVGQSGESFISSFGEKGKIRPSAQSVDIYEWDDEDDVDDVEPWGRVTISGLKATPVVPARNPTPKKTVPQRESRMFLEVPVASSAQQPVSQLTEQNTVYVQRCSYCGTENFTSDPSKPVIRCTGCGKARIKSVTPVLYRPDQKADSETFTSQSAEADRPSISLSPCEDDVGSFGITENFGASTGAVSKEWFADDTVEVKSTSITFTAIRFGRYSFTIHEGQSVTLGRRASHADFLRKDIRVSGNHCTVSSRGGKWFVLDNNSENGTFIDQRDLGEGGEGELTDGCLLVLGHKPDSMAFSVSIS